MNTWNFYNISYEPCKPREFVKSWSSRYSTHGDVKYYKSLYCDINRLKLKTRLNDNDLKNLMKWKFQYYSWRKFYDLALPIIDELNRFRLLGKITKIDEKNLWNITTQVSRTGIVAQAFLFHISHPQDYPILDRHVLRAYLYITTGILIQNNPLVDTLCDTYDKFISILKPYSMFFSSLVEESGYGSDPKAVDRALWAFGKFLEHSHSGRLKGRENLKTDITLRSIKMPSGTILQGRIIDLSQRDVKSWARRDIHVYKVFSVDYPQAGDEISLIDEEGNLYEMKFTLPDKDKYVCLGQPSRLKKWFVKHYDYNIVEKIDNTVYLEYTGNGVQFYIYTSKQYKEKHELNT